MDMTPQMKTNTFVLLLSALALASCSSNPPPNLVIVMVDTLRADHLSFQGYHRETSPHLNATLTHRAPVHRWPASSPGYTPEVTGY
jgi:glucan phosphoethanolaminetransferase (alkaline phosphatase superfamily)